jgi:cell division protein ZapA (FtsZ GTPase activity inhibitor)
MSPEREGEKQSVTVDIGGERHVLRSDAPPEYTRRVAAHVDQTIRAMGRTLDPHKAAILAALTLTDELFRAQGELAQMRAELVRRATRLADVLDRVSSETIDPPARDRPEA